MVGVGSVIAMASVLDGFDLALQNEVNNIGSNVIYITKFSPSTDWDNLSDEERNRKAITSGEAAAIIKNCDLIDGVCPQNFYFKPGGNEVKYGANKASQPRLYGTWPDYPKVRDKNVSSGRYLTELDQQYKAMVCVIGFQIADVLFPSDEPVGREIRVNGNKFTIVGVLEETKSNFGSDEDNNAVAIPLSVFEKLYPWEEELSLMARARSYNEIAAAKEEVTSVLRQFRRVPFNKDDNFALSTQDNLREEIGKVTDMVYLIGILVTSVGLMVGGIGVMNIMLVSVTERTREIGVRKAIGAKRANIIVQFLTEAMTLSGMGGIIGVFGGILLGLGINAAINFPLSISVFWIFTGFTVAVSVGLVSGIYPAIKASRLDPIESLRYE